MSSGGSAPSYSTGATGVAPEPSAPYAQSAPAPSGGKGGYNPNPYSQPPPQQVYMPPQQPTFYDQAFMQPRQPQVRSYGLGNAYARPYRSYSSPIEARPPPDEMRFVPAVMPDIPPPRDFGRPPPSEMAYPTSEQPRYAVGPTMPADFFEPPSRREYSRQMPMPMLYPEEPRYPVGATPQMPVEATQPIVSEPNYGGGIGSLYSGGFGNNVPRLPPGI